jgi:hypothetical protein
MSTISNRFRTDRSDAFRSLRAAYQAAFDKRWDSGLIAPYSPEHTAWVNRIDACWKEISSFYSQRDQDAFELETAEEERSLDRSSF